MAAKTKASAQVLGAEQSQKLERLLAGLRQRRLLNETSQSDFVVVMPPEGATRESVEVQAVSAINLGPESFQESEIRRGKEFVAEFSNYGLGTDFIGPGVAVVSTFPKNRYAMMSGTSMATPFATGMAARLLSRDEALLNMARDANRADAIIRMLSQSARKMGWSDKYSGFGVLQ